MKDPNSLPVNRFGPYPGYWTENVMLHDWPPSWQPQDIARAPNAPPPTPIEGVGWGLGSVDMPNTPKHGRPGWLDA